MVALGGAGGGGGPLKRVRPTAIGEPRGGGIHAALLIEVFLEAGENVSYLFRAPQVGYGVGSFSRSNSSTPTLTYWESTKPGKTCCLGLKRVPMAILARVALSSRINVLAANQIAQLSQLLSLPARLHSRSLFIAAILLSDWTPTAMPRRDPSRPTCKYCLQVAPSWSSPSRLVIHPIPFPNPLHKLLLQLIFAGQVELILAGVDVGVLGKGDFHQRLVLLLAEQDADGGILVGGFHEAVESS